ncbi:Uncharacterized protein C6G9.01c [Linum perenne]
MPKKGRSGEAQETPVDGQVEPRSRQTGTKKKAVNEIDKIFSGKKRKDQSQGSSTSDACVKKKKAVNEIDLIFAGKKRKSQSQEKIDSSSELKKTKSTEKKGKKKKSFQEEEERRFTGTGGGKSRRKTADGLTIYTEEELGMTKSEGGGSSLCPFDCDCCF